MNSQDRRRFDVDKAHAGERLDVFLASCTDGMSRSRIRRLIEDGAVLVNGEPAKPGQKLKTRDVVVFLRSTAPLPGRLPEPQEMPLHIVFEDAVVLVLDKEPGVVVHPAAGHWDGTLVHGLLHHTRLAGGAEERPGIVHRLDKDTSGLLVVAKSIEAHASLARQFHDRTIGRRYVALVRGSPPDQGELSGLIGRDPGNRKKFSGRASRGKYALTRFKVLERFSSLAAMVEIVLGTGRTHQIRVHMSEAGFPVLGDPVYGGRRLAVELKPVVALLAGQALHAGFLSFDHPLTQKRLEFTSPPPACFQMALELLRTLRRTSLS